MVDGFESYMRRYMSDTLNSLTYNKQSIVSFYCIRGRVAKIG